MSDDYLRRARQLSRPYRVPDGRRFRLADCDPGDTGDLQDLLVGKAVVAVHANEQDPRLRERDARAAEEDARQEEKPHGFGFSGFSFPRGGKRYFTPVFVLP